MMKKLFLFLALLMPTLLWADKTAYAEYSNGTLTFKYGEFTPNGTTSWDVSNTGDDSSASPAWKFALGENGMWVDKVTKVVFDPSFADARPKTCFAWFDCFRKLETIEGLKYLNTSEVTSMAWMFEACMNLTSLDLINFNTSNVTDMSNMFAGAVGMTTLDLSSFNTAKVTSTQYMFAGSESQTYGGPNKLKTIYVSDNWTTANVTYSDRMFDCCPNLVGGNGTTFDSKYIDKTYARIDAEGTPGYLSKVMSQGTIFTAQTAEGVDVVYEVINVEEKTCMVGYTYDREIGIRTAIDQSTSGAVTIPAIVKGYSVTRVSEYAFSDCSSLTSITIPSSVTSVGSQAFYNCSNLTSVNTTNLESWCSIQFYSFYSNPLYYAKNLYVNGELVINLVIPNTVTSIGSYAFHGCNSLTSVNIPNSVESIGVCAFQNCNGIKTLSIPNSLTSIETNAFNFAGLEKIIFNCSEVPSLFKGRNTVNEVVFGENVTSISNEAFKSCTGLTSITIPSTVTSIGKDAFSGCSGLTAVNITDLDAWCSIQFENLYSNPLYLAKNLYLNGTIVSDLVLSSTITSIGKFTFQGYNGLKSVILPNSVTSIGFHAFWDCTGLMSVTLSNKLTSIDTGAFRGCSGLASVTLPNTLTNIGNSAFYNCNALTSVTIPKSVETIEALAFYGCTSLTSVTAESETPVSITSSTFSNSANATLYVPAGCAEIYNAAEGWKEFKEKVEMAIPKTAYAVYDNGTLTFKYGYFTPDGTTSWDASDTGDDGSTSPAWKFALGENGMWVDKVTKVVFDPSFADARPKTCFAWFDCFRKLEVIEGLEYLNTSEVTSMAWMFEACMNLTSLDLTHFDTSNVTDMSNMFAGAVGMTTLDLSSFNTANVTSTQCMFAGSESQTYGGPNKLKTIYVGDDWTTANVTYSDRMFECCPNLVGGNGTKFSAEHIDKTYACIDAPGTPGYLSKKGQTTTTTWTVTSTDNIPAGTKYELEDITLTIGEAGSNDFTVNEWGEPYDETFINLIGGNGVNGNKEGGTFYLFKPKKNGNLTVVVNQNRIKKFYVEESGRVMDAFNGITKENEVTEGNYIGTYTIPVFANLTYKVYCAGSKLSFYGFTFEGRNDAEVANITFADEKVKALCVDNWDTNQDGELSFAEAAAVTDISGVFYFNKEITSFDELRFFTGLTSLSFGALNECFELKSVCIPSGIVEMNGGAFASCHKLEYIGVDASNPKFKSYGTNNAVIERAANRLVVGCPNASIPDNITTIGKAAFWGHAGEWKDIPASVTKIDEGAFAYGGLNAVNISANVEYIGESAFRCNGLWEVVIPAKVTYIGKDAFNECDRLGKVTVLNPNPIELINAETFNNRANATLSVPVGSKAAYEAAPIWKEFKRIVEPGWAVTSTDEIPAGTKVELDDITMTIGEAGSPNFTVDTWDSYDEPFTKRIVGNGVNGNKEGGTFYLFKPKKNGNLTVVVNQNRIKKFYVEESGRVMDAFNGITKENEVTEGNYIGTYTIPVFANLTYKIYCAGSKMGFYGFTFEGRNDADKTNITFADEKVKALCIANWDTDHNGELSMAEAAAVTTIGEIFKENEEITSFDELRFFTGLTELTGACFYSCTKLKSITIPSGITNIAGGYAFGNCTELEQISVDAGNTAFDSRLQCNAIIETASNTLVVGCQTTNIPATVTAIGGAAFWGRWGMSWMDIPESVSSIDYAAFAYCPNLWSIQLPKGLTHIGEDAFNESNLTEVKVQNPVPVVLENANTFSNRANATLYVPVGSKTAYEAAPIWKEFKRIVETGWAVTSTDEIPAGTKVELDDITMTIGEAGSPNFTVDTWDSYDEPFTKRIVGNGVNGDREGGTFYLFKPKKNGDLKVIVRQSVKNPKKFYVEESGRVMDAFNGILPETTDDVYIGPYTIPVFANLTYKIYCAGSKMGFYGFTFEGRDDAEWTNIEFADEKVKALCVTNWDTDHNGELSMTEAAAVTTLGNVFKENREITSFNELRFFTGLTELTGECFYTCDKMKSITIPSGVSVIDGFAFANCSDLEQISVDPGNIVFNASLQCNAIIETATNKLVVGCQASSIPEKITIIGNAAFWGRWSMPQMDIPESVKTIENDAFAYCPNLQNITLPEGLTAIGEGAFNECTNLTEVKAQNPVPVVLTNAKTFSNRANAKLFVPNESVTTYQNANIWQDFSEIAGLYTNHIYSDDVTAYLGCPTEMAICLENEETYTAFQFDLVLPEGITLEKNEKGNVIFTKGDRYSGTRTITITPHEGNMYRIVSASIKNNEITGNSGALLTISLLADESLEKKTYTANIENVILTKPDESQLDARSSTISITTREVLYGDSNDDGNVNVTDAVVSINNILGRPSVTFNKTQADINRDHIVDIYDVYLGLRIIRNNVRMMSRAGESSDDKLSISDFTITPGETKQFEIELNNEASYAGFQFDLVLPEGISMTGYSVNQTRIPEEIEVDMEQTDGCYRFIAAGFGTEEISGTSGSIMKITLKADENLKGRNLTGYLRDVKLSKLDGTGTTIDETAFKITNPTSGDLSGNGTLGKEDVSEMVSLIMSGTYDAKADLNGDSKVNAADLVLLTNATSQNVPVSGVSISTSESSINVGNTLQLEATVSPSNATNQNVTWSSSNPEIATVDETTGLVTGVAVGTATITATSVDGGKTATATVNVVETLSGYYWYIGTENPSSISNIQTDNTVPGWHEIGTSISGFEIGILNRQSAIVLNTENVKYYYYAVIPNDLHIYAADGNTNVENSYFNPTTCNIVGYKAFHFKLDPGVRLVQGLIIKE